VEIGLAKGFAKCEDLVDKHVGAFERCDGKIQNIDYEDVIGQCFDCSNKVQPKPPLWHHMLLGLSCLLPLMGAMNGLMKLAQGKDVFICNFVVVVKIY
jgi:hypothetical protein